MADKDTQLGFDPLEKPQQEDVQSFVLRLHVNPAPGGGRVSRPRFSLEHVNQGVVLHMKNLGEVLQELSARINKVLREV